MKLDRQRSKALLSAVKAGDPVLSPMSSLLKGRLYSEEAVDEKDLLGQAMRDMDLNDLVRNQRRKR